MTDVQPRTSLLIYYFFNLLPKMYFHTFGCSISPYLLPVFVSLNSGQILVFGERSMRALVSWQTTQTGQSRKNQKKTWKTGQSQKNIEDFKNYTNQPESEKPEEKNWKTGQSQKKMEYLKNQQTTKTGQSQKILSWEQGFGSWLKLFSDSNGRREFGYNVRYCVFLTFVNVFKYFPTQVAAGGSALCSLHCSLLCIDAVRKIILCSALQV